MIPREDLDRLVREEFAASGDDDAAREAREEQAREHAADAVIEQVEQRRGRRPLS